MTDRDLNNAGRLTRPMVLRSGDTHNEFIAWADALRTPSVAIASNPCLRSGRMNFYPYLKPPHLFNDVKSAFLFLCLLGCTLQAVAQQTIFNVPSSEITPKHKILAQQQVDLNREELRSTTTIDVGLGRNWEAGVNLYNLDYLPPQHTWQRNDTTTQMPYAPLLLINAQKIFGLTDNLNLGIGGQTGINLYPTEHSSWVGWGYVNLGGSFADDHYKAVIGGYAGSQRYLADGSTVGFHAGFDAGIWYEKLHILGDWATGSHEYGQLVLGVEVYLQKHLPLAVGWRRSNRDGEQGLVVQLTYSPW